MRKALISDLLWTLLIIGILTALAISIAARQFAEMNEFNAFAQKSAMTEGTIINISRQPRGLKSLWLVDYTYTANGKDHSRYATLELKPSNNTKTIKVYYDPNDPDDSMADISVNFYFNIALAFLFLVFLLGMAFFSVRYTAYFLNLVRNDKFMVFGNWQEVRAEKLSVIPRCSVVCKGKKYSFKSGSYFPGKCPYKKGTPIKVYVDPDKNPKMYCFAPPEK